METVREKRLYPRIKEKLKVDISRNILGETIDLSEGGVRFNSPEDISRRKISLRIHFLHQRLELNAKAKIIWRREREGGYSTYGTEFVNLDETHAVLLRKELIKTQISELLRDIKSSQIKREVSHFFLKDVLDYISRIIKLIPDLSKQEKYSLELEKYLDHLNIQILLKGYCLEMLLSNEQIVKRIKETFRQLVGTWIYKSVVLKRAFERPRGYAGDYKMLELIYDKKAVSGNIGVYFDNNFLKSPYAVGIRLRKSFLRDLLRDFINKATAGEIRILNIGCGSCRELRELLPHLTTEGAVTFICVDWDEESLNFSRDMVSCKDQGNIAFKFVKEDILDLIKNKAHLEVYGKLDLIYSIGLIDYLPDRVLKRVIGNLFRLLKVGGKLVVTHKNREKTIPPVFPDWFCNWKAVPRNKEEVVKLFYECGVPRFSLSLGSDDFEYTYYFTLTKMAEAS